MVNKLFVPATALLLVALVGNILVSLSLPFINFMDVSRISTDKSVLEIGEKEIRFGIWAGCSWNYDNKRSCSKPTGPGYEAQIGTVDKDGFETMRITPAWTRGLAAHPVATGTVAIALALSLSTRHNVNLAAHVATLFSAFVILIVFAIQLALHLHLKVKVGRAAAGAKVNAGPGFWITLGSLVLVIASSALMFIKRRKQAQIDAGYPMLANQNKGILSIFRRN